jgi:molybdate transport system substrate-binding protein
MTRVFAGQVTVFAAASLIEPLREIAADYEKQSGDKVVFNFAASGLLARQIEEGAPADIFFSADEAKVEELAKKGLLANETRRSRLANSLVLVAGMDAPAMRSPAELTNAAIRRIGLGDTKTVPAGTYAKAYLEKAGVWAAVERKVIPCENVRAVLAAVESGNVDVGIVYKTDAAISKKAKVVFEVPAGEGPKITYPVVLVKGSPSPEAAKKFLERLESDDADAVFARHGFGILHASAKR